MVVSGLGLMFGGRADPARVRPGAERATVEGRLRIDPDGQVAPQVLEAGGELDDDGGSLIVSRSVSAEGRSRALRGRPVGPRLAAHLPRRRPGRRARAGRPAAAAAAGPAAPGPGPVRRAGARRAVLTDYQRAYQRHRDVRGRARRADHARPGSGRPRPRICAAAWPRSSGPSPPKARTPSCWPRRSGSRTPTRCMRPRPRRMRRCWATRPAGPTRPPTRSACWAGPAGAGGRGGARPGAGGAGGQAVRGLLPRLRRGRRAGLLRAVGRLRPGPARGRCRNAAPS